MGFEVMINKAIDLSHLIYNSSQAGCPPSIEISFATSFYIFGMRRPSLSTQYWGFVIRAQQKHHSYLFTNPKTQRPYTAIKTAWLTACKLAGITGLRFHDLRQTFGTRAADAGVPLPAIRDVMGHKSTTMTERYAHATNEGKRRAVEAVMKPKHNSINIATSKGRGMRVCESRIGNVWILKGFLMDPAGFEPTTKGI